MKANSYTEHSRLPGRRFKSYRLCRGFVRTVPLTLMITAVTLTNPMPVFAQDAAIDEIIVTARFREERLQDTPIAITAMSTEGLEARNLTSVEEVGDFAPNVILNTSSSGFGPTMVAYIRGMGATDFSLSVEPGVAVYIDDVYHGRPTGSQLDLLDLERVEILRGPQGTLFGKNNIGGAIRLIPKKPQGDGTGYLEFTTGSYNRIDLRGALDATLIPDRLFARIAGSSKKRDGYHKILDYACVNPGDTEYANSLLGRQVGLLGLRADNCVVDTNADVDVDSARVALRLLASDDVEINFAFDYTIQDQRAPADKQTVMQICSTCTSEGLFAGWFNTAPGLGSATYGVDWDQRFMTNSNFTTYERYDDPLTGRKAGNQNDLEHWGFVGTIDWDIGNLHVTSITGYRDFSAEFGRGSDGSPMPLTMTHDFMEHEQFSQEIRVSSSALDARLDWTVGGYYYDADDSIRSWLIFFPGFVGLATANNDGTDFGKTTNLAGFVHGIYHFNDQLSFTAGIRVTDDEKIQNQTRSYADNIGQRPTDPATGLPFPVGFVFLDVPDTELSETVPTYKIGLDYRWTDEVMTYFQWSTGFRGGGLNARPTSLLQVRSFESDSLETFELGLKSDWFDRRLRVNAAAFFGDWTDLQIPIVTTDALGNPFFPTGNAGQADVYGVELEFLAQPFDGLTLEGTLGWVEFEYGDLGPAGDDFVSGGPCASCRSVRTPEWTYSLGAAYTFLLGGNGGTLTLRADYAYQSKYFYDVANTAPEPGYGLLNARASWESADELWRVSIFGTNLTDEFYCSNQLSFDNPVFARQQCSSGAPSMWGLSARYHF